MQKQLKRVLLFLGIVTLFWGCKATHKTVFVEKQTEAQLLLQEVRKAEPKFTSMEFKRMTIGVNLQENTSYNSSASCRIIPDSVIHISVQPFFGIEMFIVSMTPKQIVVIDKIKGIYYQSDYSIFEQHFGFAINYQMFESLFTNKFFSLNTNEDQGKSMTSTVENNGNRVLSSKQAGLNQRFLLNNNNRIMEMTVNTDKGSDRFETHYSNFTEAGKILFPSGIRFQFNSTSGLFSLNMSISRFAVNEPVTIPALNLIQYRQGEISSLIK